MRAQRKPDLVHVWKFTLHTGREHYFLVSHCIYERLYTAGWPGEWERERLRTKGSRSDGWPAGRSVSHQMWCCPPKDREMRLIANQEYCVSRLWSWREERAASKRERENLMDGAHLRRKRDWEFHAYHWLVCLLRRRSRARGGHSPIPHNHSLLVKAHLKVADCRRRVRVCVCVNIQKNALTYNFTCRLFQQSNSSSGFTTDFHSNLHSKHQGAPPPAVFSTGVKENFSKLFFV